jgi:hypothetical protein
VPQGGKHEKSLPNATDQPLQGLRVPSRSLEPFAAWWCRATVVIVGGQYKMWRGIQNAEQISCAEAFLLLHAVQTTFPTIQSCQKLLRRGGSKMQIL